MTTIAINLPRKGLRHLAVSYVHNCVAHRLLFLADILDELGLERASAKLDEFHDWTASFYE